MNVEPTSAQSPTELAGTLRKPFDLPKSRCSQLKNEGNWTIYFLYVRWDVSLLFHWHVIRINEAGL